MFETIDDVIDRFAMQKYICDRRIATVVYLATHLEKPILVEGPAGVGKTELAKVVAAALDHELIRLQCYEGLDEAKALYEWEYAKQLLYTQILKDKIGEVLGGARIAARGGRPHRQRGRRLLLGPLHPAAAAAARDHLGAALRAADRRDRQVGHRVRGVPARGPERLPGQRSRARHAARQHIPLVVLTSNNAREMSDALKRRCLHLYIDFPPARTGARRSCASRCPASATGSRAQVVDVVQRVRQLDLKKAPSISETLDWAKTLTLLNVERLDEELVDRHAERDPQVRGRHPQGAGRAQGRTCRRQKARADSGRAATTRICCTERRGRVPTAWTRRSSSSRRCCAQNGLRVSMSEHLDAFQRRCDASASASAQRFKDVLRATMVKRAVDLPVYDELFDLYFSGLGRGDPARAPSRCMAVDAAQRGRLPAPDGARSPSSSRSSTSTSRSWREALLRNDTGAPRAHAARGGRAGATCRASSAPIRKAASATARRRRSGSARWPRSSSGSRSSSGGADLPPELAEAAAAASSSSASRTCAT